MDSKSKLSNTKRCSYNHFRRADYGKMYKNVLSSIKKRSIGNSIIAYSYKAELDGYLQRTYKGKKSNLHSSVKKSHSHLQQANSVLSEDYESDQNELPRNLKFNPHTLKNKIYSKSMKAHRDVKQKLERKLDSYLSKIQRKSSLQKLCLRKASLAYIPKDIGNLKNIAYCDLSNNKLKTLPNSFYDLNTLKYLNLSKNQFKELSARISQFVNLEVFICSFNFLVKLPSSFGRLDQLKELVLSDNRICSLPGTFCDLIALKSVDLSNNSLQSLPDDMRQMVNLKHLLVQNNFLSDLNFLAGCDLITLLNAQNNVITELPTEWGSSVKVLNMGKNKLKEIPFDIYNMGQLRKLNFARNDIKRLPVTMARLSMLSEINLNENPFSTVFSLMVLGKKYKRVSLVKRKCHEQQYVTMVYNQTQPEEVCLLNICKNMPQYMPAFRAKHSFRAANFSGTNLKFLPIEFEFICQCAVELQTNSESHKIPKAPPFMTKFLELTKVNLSHNKLSDLTDSFGVLSEITELDISYNQFSRVPACVFMLKNLVFLNLKENDIHNVDIKNLSLLTKLTTLKLTWKTITISQTELKKEIRRTARRQSTEIEESDSNNEDLSCDPEQMEKTCKNVSRYLQKKRNAFVITKHYQH